MINLLFLILGLTACINAEVDACDYRVFNWNFYLSHNKDLIRGGRNDANAACSHWRSSGANEGRQAHPKFHSRQYCEQYEDLRNAKLCHEGHFMSALTHYLEHGIPEGRHGYISLGGHGMWTMENELFTVTASAIHAGAISSIVYKDQVEIVNSYDHGRQLQYAFTDSTGECNNPTEAGGGFDGLKDETTSVLHGIRVVPGQYIATTTQPAYWKGPEDPCTHGRSRLSPFMVSKQVTINYMGNKNLISYEISFGMIRDFDMLSFECPTLYMPATFNRVFTLDLSKKTYEEIPLPGDWKEAVTTKPIMYMNAEGVAVGVRLTRVGGVTGAFHYAYFGRLATNKPIDYTTKWSAWFHTAAPVKIGTQISTQMYIAVGTPQEVINALIIP